MFLYYPQCSIVFSIRCLTHSKFKIALLLRYFTLPFSPHTHTHTHTTIVGLVIIIFVMFNICNLTMNWAWMSIKTFTYCWQSVITWIVVEFHQSQKELHSALQIKRNWFVRMRHNKFTIISILCSILMGVLSNLKCMNACLIANG